MNKATDLIKQHRPCSSAVEWLADKTPQEAWDTCPRGDWMLWFYAKMHPDNLKELTLAKGHCANTVRHLMKDERSLKAVDTAIAFGEGKATREDLDAAADAAYAVYAAAAYAVYAAEAAAHTAYTAYADAAAEAAAHTAAHTANAAAAYAAYAAAANAAYAAHAAYAAAANAAYAAHAADADADAARKENQKQTANSCRKYLRPIF